MRLEQMQGDLELMIGVGGSIFKRGDITEKFVRPYDTLAALSSLGIRERGLSVRERLHQIAVWSRNSERVLNPRLEKMQAG
jgi:hypothetical protein